MKGYTAGIGRSTHRTEDVAVGCGLLQMNESRMTRSDLLRT
jgi:hypothetical protein